MEGVPIPEIECNITTFTNSIKKDELKYAEYKKQYTEMIIKIQNLKMLITKQKLNLKDVKQEHYFGMTCRYCRAKEKEKQEQVPVINTLLSDMP